MNKVCKTCGGFDICIMGHAGRTAECPEWRPKWIPVSERLPKGADGKGLAEDVIAYTITGEVLTGWIFGDRWWLLPNDQDHHFTFGENYVTHWMPLPEPPKQVIDNEQIEVE